MTIYKELFDEYVIGTVWKKKKDPSQFDKKWSINNKIKWECFLKQLVSNGPLNIHVHVWCIPGKMYSNVFK